MNSVNKSGVRNSFIGLYKDNSTLKIQIPIIQRDYAQGRQSKNEVRENFLDALYNYLDSNEPNRDLDFVYGSTEKTSDGDVFIPLDGQQRLTTLFLLHWYLSVISDNLPHFESIVSKDKKTKFTYLTRFSSAEFCDALLNNEIEISNLLKSDDNEENSLSKTIVNSGWFFRSWKQDPTIMSMLVMLDAIHYKFQNRPEFYDRLTDDKNPIITFLYLDLDEFKLTEDLFIKMNSRGKTLTSFENFKAKLEKYIGDEFKDDKETYSLDFNGQNKKVNLKEYFSYKIDTSWADLFWKYRELVGNKFTYDDELMNYIRFIFTCQFAVDIDEKEVELFQYLLGSNEAKKKKDYSDKISFQRYSQLKAISKNSVKYIVDSLDALENGNDKIKTRVLNPFYLAEDEQFSKSLKFELDMPETIRLHAYLRFLILNREDRSGLDHWCRVVFNLTENTPIDRPEQVIRAIKSIERLLSNSNRILDALIEDNDKIDFYYERQVQEERIKAHLIKRSTEWSDAIIKAETHPYLAGQICFLLEFSGVLEFFEQNGNCNWDSKQNEQLLNSFKVYSHKSKPILDIIFSDNKLEYIVERAVLTKGIYLIRGNFLSTKSNFRDYSFNRLLRLPPLNDKEKKVWEDKRLMFKELLDDSIYDPHNIEKSLAEICKTKLNDWRDYFVINPSLINYCTKGFIDFESENEIYIMKHIQRNHKHREMFTYNFYTLYLKDNEDEYKPFKVIEHMYTRSHEDWSFIQFREWFFHRKQYQLEIYKYPDMDGFELRFLKAKDPSDISNYGEELVTLIQSIGYKWRNEELAFFKVVKTEASLLLELKLICNQLNNL